LLPCFLVRSFPLALLPPLCPSRRVLALSLPYFKSLNTFIRTIQSSMLHQSSCSYSAFQMRTVLTLASLLVLLSCLGMLPSCSVQAGVVPGRMLNKGHEEVFAAQAKESERTKQRERKPFLACPAGLIPCLANGDSESVRNDVYECVDVSASLQSCGGCSLKRDENGDFVEGEGTDCTAIENVKAVECRAGQCEISSCRAGYKRTSLGCI